MDCIFFQKKDGRFVIGSGPFQKFSQPPQDEVAFYVNDYSLLDGEPWYVPAKVEEGESLPFLSDPEFSVNWSEPPRVDGFAAIFGEVMEEIRAGHLEKAVPVVVERGQLQEGALEGLGAHLKETPKALRIYGWRDGEKTVIGATPEVLFALKGKKLTTMALAGTARGEEKEVFDVDEKEIREHEFVAQTLVSKLSDVGTPQRLDRRVMDLGELVHFHTPIEVDLFAEREPSELIRRLHPTPALGPLPRTQETIEGLVDWRDRLGCPVEFGAPFGLSQGGEVEVLVAIRMIYRKGNEVLIPSGCGVIEESRLMNEWRELRLKRDAVKRLFGLS